MKRIKKTDFIYYDGILYRLKYRTSKPQYPPLLICAIVLKLGDTDKHALLLRKDRERVTCYDQPRVYGTPPVDETTAELIQLERERIVQIVKDVEQKHIKRFPIIWIVELYDKSLMVIPEAKVRRLAL